MAARGAPEPSGGYHHSGHDPHGQKLLPELQPYTQERAEKLIDLIQSKGSTIARSHCNIEPVSGLKNWKICRRYWRAVSGFDCEIVAFPQHGLLLSNSES